MKSYLDPSLATLPDRSTGAVGAVVGAACCRSTLSVAATMLLAGMAGAAPPPAPAQPEPASGIAAFRALAQRNIFDPTRTRNQTESAAPSDQRPEAGPRVDSIVLTGTILYEGKAFAFFGGSRPDYRQILSPTERIAEFTVTEITTAQVVLQSETNHLILPVGRELRRGPSQIWEVSATAAVAALPSAPPGRAGPPNASTNGPTPPSPETSDLLKQMMERRQKEIAQ